MKQALIIILLFFSEISSAAFVFKKSGASPIQTRLEVDLGLGGYYVDSKQVESRVFGAYGNIRVDQKLAETLNFEIDSIVVLESGSSKSLLLDEFAPDQGIFLNDAFLKWEPVSFLKFKGGALNQGHYNSPLLLTDTAFVGASQLVNLQLGEENRFYIELQQSIPNNHALTNRVGSVDEGTPAFFIETAGLDLSASWLIFKLAVSQFSFNKLSNAVAFQSQFMGNSISSGTVQTARFLYGYKGYNARLFMECFPLPEIGLWFDGHYIYNDKAPDNRNSGMLGTLGLSLYGFDVYGEFFSNDSDSSPAFYNNKFFGHNNREGHGVGLKNKSDDDSFAFNLNYRKNKVADKNIAQALYQSDTEVFKFSISKAL